MTRLGIEPRTYGLKHPSNTAPSPREGANARDDGRFPAAVATQVPPVPRAIDMRLT